MTHIKISRFFLLGKARFPYTPPSRQSNDAEIIITDRF